MRIVIITNSFPSTLDEDPAFPASWELANGLVKAGHDVMALSLAGSPSDQTGAYCLNGIRVYKAKMPPGINTVFTSHPKLANGTWLVHRTNQLYKEAKEVFDYFKPDVVESQEFFGLGLPFLTDADCASVVRCYGAASIMCKSGFYKGYSDAEINILETFEHSSILLADGLIAICSDVADRLAKASGRPRDDFAIIRTPLSASALKKTNYALNASGPRLIFLGQVARLKGADVLIDSLPYIAEKFPAIKATFVGFNATEIGDKVPYSEILTERLRRHGLEKNVRFPGYLKRAEIVDLAIASDMAIFPSRYETACYSCLEAMSYGLPVVASRVGGMQEYCLDQECGLLFESENSRDLAAKVISLLENIELRTKLGQAARQRIETTCSVSSNVQQTLAAYERAREVYSTSGRNATKAMRSFVSKFMELAEIPSERLCYAADLEKALASAGDIEVQSTDKIASPNMHEVPGRVLAKELAKRVRSRSAALFS